MGCVVEYALVPSVVHSLGRSSELVLAAAVVIVDALGRLGFAATTKTDPLARAIPGALIFLILPILPMIFSDYANLKNGLLDESALTAWAWNYFWVSCAGGFLLHSGQRRWDYVSLDRNRIGFDSGCFDLLAYHPHNPER